MEAGEENSDQKAKVLINRFKNKFRGITFTRHELRAHEAKGKASNVSWCAEHMPPTFEKLMIPKEDVMIAVLDADSWAPSLFFEEIDQYLQKNPENKHKICFGGPQIYTRNNLDVTFIVRVSDMMHSYIHMANIPPIFFSFPLSNYSVSYVLMEKIGFWDTCADAVAEDFHTGQKIYWKTGGDCILAPIYVPFNQLSLKVDGGFCKNFAAKFWQAERHTEGIEDVSYNLKMLFNKPFRFKNIIMTYFVFETFTLPALIPWCMFFIIARYIVMSEEGFSGDGWAFSWIFVNVVINVINIFSIAAYGVYEIYKRKTNKEIYER